MQELNKRNTETVELVIKQQNAKLIEQQQRIDLLSTAVSNLTVMVNELQTMLMIQKIKLTGHGPTM